MADLLSYLYHPSLLIGLAIACQSASFLLTGQVKLRLLFLTGTLISIFYFTIVLKDPLWEPVIEDFILGAANIYGLTVLILGRSPRLIPADQRVLFEKLDCLQPGEFRALMKHGIIRDVEEDEVLTVEGDVPDRLFYLLEGSVDVIRDDGVIKLPVCDFIGEVSLILETPASATTKAFKGSRIVEWRRESLTRSMRRNETLKISLEALLAQNMAHKVARKPIFEKNQ